MDPVCDLCGGLDPQWDWLTPNKVTVAEALDGLGMYFEDPHWLVCNTCHQLILDDKQDVLEQRALLNIPVVADAILMPPPMRAALETGQRDEVTRMHRAFWDYKTEYTAIEES